MQLAEPCGVALSSRPLSSTTPTSGPESQGKSLKQPFAFLLKACFVGYDKIIQGPYSPYNLLRSGKLVIDLALMRGVVAASKWIGPHALPAGYISEWPSLQENPYDLSGWQEWLCPTFQRGYEPTARAAMRELGLEV